MPFEALNGVLVKISKNSYDFSTDDNNFRALCLEDCNTESIRLIIDFLKDQRCGITALRLKALSQESIALLSQFFQTNGGKITSLYIDDMQEDGVSHLLKALEDKNCKIIKLNFKLNPEATNKILESIRTNAMRPQLICPIASSIDAITLDELYDFEDESGEKDWFHVNLQSRSIPVIAPSSFVNGNYSWPFPPVPSENDPAFIAGPSGEDHAAQPTVGGEYNGLVTPSSFWQRPQITAEEEKEDPKKEESTKSIGKKRSFSDS